MHGTGALSQAPDRHCISRQPRPVRKSLRDGDPPSRDPAWEQHKTSAANREEPKRKYCCRCLGHRRRKRAAQGRHQGRSGRGSKGTAETAGSLRRGTGTVTATVTGGLGDREIGPGTAGQVRRNCECTDPRSYTSACSLPRDCGNQGLGPGIGPGTAGVGPSRSRMHSTSVAGTWRGAALFAAIARRVHVSARIPAHPTPRRVRRIRVVRRDRPPPVRSAGPPCRLP